MAGEDAIETRAATGVTGRPGRMDAHKKRIGVAIGADFDDFLHVARCLAFVPERATRARPEPRLAAFERALERFGVHPGHHQDIAAFGILNDGGNQAVRVEFEIRRCFHAPRLAGRPIDA